VTKATKSTPTQPWEARAHERHVYLYKHCSLCVREAGVQTDRLLDDDGIEAIAADDAARFRVQA